MKGIAMINHERDTMARETRKQNRLEKLGTNEPLCGICGEADWRVMDLHHVAGHGRDDLTVCICANDHRRVTDDQKDHPPFCSDADPLLDKVGHFLLGLADMLKLIVERLYEFGRKLIERASIANSEAKP
jgi:hypothetical protein